MTTRRLIKNIIENAFERNPKSHNIKFVCEEESSIKISMYESIKVDPKKLEEEISEKISIYDIIARKYKKELFELETAYINNVLTLEQLTKELELIVDTEISVILNYAAQDAKTLAKRLDLVNRKNALKKLWDMLNMFPIKYLEKNATDNINEFFKKFDVELYSISHIILKKSSEEETKEVTDPKKEIEFYILIRLECYDIMVGLENTFCEHVEAFIKDESEDLIAFKSMYPEIFEDKIEFNRYVCGKAQISVKTLTDILQDILQIRKQITNKIKDLQSSDTKKEKKGDNPTESEKIQQYVSMENFINFANLYNLDLDKILSYKKFDDFLAFLRRKVCEVLRYEIKNELDIRDTSKDEAINQIIYNKVTITKDNFYVPSIDELISMVDKTTTPVTDEIINNEICSLFDKNSVEDFQQNLLRIAEIAHINISAEAFCERVNSRFKSLESNTTTKNKYSKFMQILNLAFEIFTKKEKYKGITDQQCQILPVDDYFNQIINIEVQLQYLDSANSNITNLLTQLIKLQHTIQNDNNLLDEDKSVLIEEINRIYQENPLLNEGNITYLAVSTAKKLIMQK